MQWKKEETEELQRRRPCPILPWQLYHLCELIGAGCRVHLDLEMHVTYIFSLSSPSLSGLVVFCPSRVPQSSAISHISMLSIRLLHVIVPFKTQQHTKYETLSWTVCWVLTLWAVKGSSSRPRPGLVILMSYHRTSHWEPSSFLSLWLLIKHPLPEHQGSLKANHSFFYSVDKSPFVGVKGESLRGEDLSASSSEEENQRNHYS